MLGESSAGLHLLKRDIGCFLARAASCAAAALVRRRWRTCRNNMVLPVLLLPLARLGAVGNLLGAVSLQLHGVLLCLGKLAAVGGVVLRRPVPHFLLYRRLSIAGIRVIAQQLWSAFAV